jgi:DNA mismatch repair protein MutL
VNIFSGNKWKISSSSEEDTEIVIIQGFVSKPEFAKKSRGEQFFFVNDRFIKSGYLHHAVMAAYEGICVMELNLAYFFYT